MFVPWPRQWKANDQGLEIYQEDTQKLRVCIATVSNFGIARPWRWCRSVWRFSEINIGSWNITLGLESSMVAEGERCWTGGRRSWESLLSTVSCLLLLLLYSSLLSTWACRSASSSSLFLSPVAARSAAVPAAHHPTSNHPLYVLLGVSLYWSTSPIPPYVLSKVWVCGVVPNFWWNLLITVFMAILTRDKKREKKPEWESAKAKQSDFRKRKGFRKHWTEM